MCKHTRHRRGVLSVLPSCCDPQQYERGDSEFATPQCRQPQSFRPLQALDTQLAAIGDYLGHSAVYVSMSDIWYDRLYKHSVLGHTVHDTGAISQLDDVMGTIMERASDRAAEGAAAAVARAAFAALRTTLLHGGVLRNFVSDDAELLRKDVEAMRVRTRCAT